MSDVTVHGLSLIFGFKDADAPTIANFVPTSCDLKWEPEVFVTATAGEGHVVAVANSLPANRMITGSFTGYAEEGWDPSTLADNFTFKDRYFLIKPIGDPRKKAEFAEVNLEVVSYSKVTS